MLEVKISGIRMSLVTQHRVVILQEIAHPERHLPIWIGAYEADAIAVATQKVAVSRPLTHDFILTLLQTTGTTLLRVVINALEEGGTFFALCVLEHHNGELVEVDCRPSDALALVARTTAPIFVDEKVMEQAGVIHPDTTKGTSLSEEQGPQTSDDSPQAETKSAEVANEPAANIKVLIIDPEVETHNNLVNLLYFERGLEILGGYTDGQDAVEQAVELQPQLILLEMNTPNLEDTARSLLQKVPGVSIIMMSSGDEKENLYQAIRAGARDYLVKPFSGKVVIETIRRVSGQSS